MSANIDSMMYVGEVPWHGLGVQYETAPTSAEEVIKGAKLDWTVSAHELSSDIEPNMRNYHAIYRDDSNTRLGVVHCLMPQVVQNSDMLYAIEPQLGKGLSTETAASLGQGQQVFGCFKLKADDKVVDDEVATYFVMLNDHTVANGKVTAIITPIRVVCSNTLSAALSNSLIKVRVPIVEDIMINQNTCNMLLDQQVQAISTLNKKAETWLKRKVDRAKMDIIMDKLFPYPEPDDAYSEKNASMEMQRETFLTKCMDADNLNNYKGTVYQVYNALTDYSQHYFKNPEKAYDLKYRMQMIPGMGQGADTPAAMVGKFVKLQEQMFKNVA